MKKRLIPLYALMGITTLVVVALILWALFFGAYFLVVILVLCTMVVFPRKIDAEHHWHVRLGAGGALLVLMVFSSPVWLGQINDRIARIAETPRTQEGVASLSLRDKVGVLGLNTIMGVVAYPIYPEASKETLLLMRKPKSDAIRVFKSDFAMKSKRIADEIEAFEYALVYEKRDSIMVKKRFAWTGDAYAFGSREARVALALNPAVLQLKAVRQDSVWRVQAALRVSVEYPPRAKVTLIKKPKLEIEEGIFWLLQEAKWLHPYDAIWRWDFTSAKTNKKES